MGLPTRAATLALLSGLACAPAFGADPAGIAIVAPSGQTTTLTPADLAQLPAVHVDVSFIAEGTTHHASFDGPLLWTVLDRAHAVTPGKPRVQAPRIVLVSGADRYVAALAVGELSPELEAKQVILADRMNGKPLDPAHLRVVVPGDKHGARSVRDVVRIEVISAHGSNH